VSTHQAVGQGLHHNVVVIVELFGVLGNQLGRTKARTRRKQTYTEIQSDGQSVRACGRLRGGGGTDRAWARHTDADRELR
jgi:hypothetical protein